MDLSKAILSLLPKIIRELIEKCLVTVFTLIFLVTLAVKFVIGELQRKSTGKLSKEVQKRFKELPSLPIVGALHQVHLNKNDTGKLLLQWRKKYGSCWRTKVCGRNILFIHDPTLLKTFLESGDVGHLEKFPFLYNILFIGASRNGLVSMPAKAWQPHRKAINTLFTYEALKNYVNIFTKHGDQLVKELDAKQNQYHDVVHVKTLDIISEIAMGLPMETILGRGGCVQFYQNMSTIQKIMSEKLFFKPWILIPSIWKFNSMRKELYASVDAVEAAVGKIRKCHVPNAKSRYALDLMINEHWSDDEITAELITFIATGHETVSRTLNTFLWMLALEQKHQLACQEEIDQLFDSLESCGKELTLPDLTKLKHLERCLKETLRIYSSTPFGTGRELQKPLKLNNDLTLESGTILMFSVFVLHRDPDSFPNPELFDPERFSPENAKQRHAYSYLPFSGGPRNCVGWKLAIIEITVLCAKILREFHLTTRDRREDIQMMFSSTLYPSREPNITFRRRR